MSTASEIVRTLRQMGFYDIVLPWLFTFAITLPLLRAIFSVKKDDKKEPIKLVPEIIAMVIAFSVVYYTPWGQTVQGFFTELFGGSIMVLAGIFIIVLMFSFVPGVRDFLECPMAPIWALLTGEETKKVIENCKNEKGFRAFGFLLIGIGAILTLSAWRQDIPIPYIPRQYAYLAGIFLLIVAIVLLFRKPSSGEAKGGGGSGGEDSGKGE